MNDLHNVRNSIGNTGIAVSPLGLGTVKFGRNQGVKYPTAFDLPSDAEALNLLALAQDLGINLVDTAPAYGSSETRLGTLLAGRRHEWVVCTKVGEEFEGGVSRFDFSAAHTRFSIERSLRRLNTDFLDLVLVHSDGNDLEVLGQEVYATLEEIKREGKIRAFGFSGKTVAGGIKALGQGDCAMVTYNLNERAERQVLDHALSHQKGILVKKAFASGHLCQQGEDPIRQALELLYSHPAVSSAIVGTINPEHLKHNVAAALSVLAGKPGVMHVQNHLSPEPRSIQDSGDSSSSDP